MRLHDLVIAIVVVAFLFLLSLPYQFGSDYWAETPVLWAIYFVVGALLAAYIFYALLQARRRLMSDGRDDKEV
jgi:ABC-type Na+ efflux pump permease subunit